MNSDISSRDRLAISTKNKISLLNHIRTDFCDLWSISLHFLTLSESDLFPLKSIAALGFLDISYSKISLEALISSIHSIQILEFHYFGCFSSYEEEYTRGFLVYCLPDVWSLNGVVINCIEKSQMQKYFEVGMGRFSEIYRKHYIHHSEFLSSTEPVFWTDKAKILLGAVTSKFTMVSIIKQMLGI